MLLQCFQFQSRTSFGCVLMIFSHQDVPSFVGKSCQDVPSLGRKNQWVRSCLSISMLLQCSQLQNGTSYQTWGQVHEYLYLSTLKYRFESTCTLLKYFLNFPSVLVLILKYFAKYLYVLEYLSTCKYCKHCT